MAKTTSKHLSEIKNEFERGVFIAVYCSRKQKVNRMSAVLMLIIKHVLRGVLFSWPLYMLFMCYQRCHYCYRYYLLFRVSMFPG